MKGAITTLSTGKARLGQVDYAGASYCTICRVAEIAGLPWQLWRVEMAGKSPNDTNRLNWYQVLDNLVPPHDKEEEEGKEEDVDWKSGELSIINHSTSRPVKTTPNRHIWTFCLP